jgi:hypothetical protein
MTSIRTDSPSPQGSKAGSSVEDGKAIPAQVTPANGKVDPAAV